MIVADLLEKKPKGLFVNDSILQCDLIALDGKDDKILFDTYRNKREHINKFLNGEIMDLWADVRPMRDCGFGSYYKPVMKCYVAHNSWLKESD